MFREAPFVFRRRGRSARCDPGTLGNTPVVILEGLAGVGELSRKRATGGKIPAGGYWITSYPAVAVRSSRMAPHRSRATEPAASSIQARDSGAWSR